MAYVPISSAAGVNIKVDDFASVRRRLIKGGAFFNVIDTVESLASVAEMVSSDFNPSSIVVIEIGSSTGGGFSITFSCTGKIKAAASMGSVPGCPPSYTGCDQSS